MEKIIPHKRINDIMLGPLERPALRWLASRMPLWITPDILTGLGVFASVIICISYWLTLYNHNFLWLASFGLVLNWFGDSLDGNLARFRNIERPKYGYFIDHTVDALSELLIGIGIGLSPFVRFDLALLALVSYLLMSVLVYITTYVKGVFRISFSKVGPTEIRLIIILSNTLIYFIGNPSFTFSLGTYTIYDCIAVLFSVVLFTVFIVITLKQAIELAKLEVPANK
jgi:archaetidylinositol phosphate synthase